MRPDGYLDELKAARNAANAAPAARDDEERAEESAMMNTAKNLTSRLESMNIASSHAAATSVLSSPQSLPKGGDRFAEGTVRSHGEGALWKRTKSCAFRSPCPGA